MNIVIREYTEKDKSALAKLNKKLQEYIKSIDPLHRIKNLPGFSEMAFQDTMKELVKYQGKVLLAEDTGKIVGCIIGVIWEQTEKNKLEIGPHVVGEVLDFYLEELYRNQRIGTKMLKMLACYFKEKGCDSMWVSFAAFNTVAHEAYKKFGFVEREIGMLKEL